jgi:hypothetical protein
MPTVLDVLSSAARKLGVLAAGDTLDAGDAQVLLAAGNELLDAWSAQQLAIYVSNRVTFSLVANRQVYAMGTGAPDFDAPRPTRLDRAGVLLTTTGPQPVERPIQVLTDGEWAATRIKNLAGASTFPTRVWPDYSYPFCNLTFWPVPTTACSVALYPRQALASLENLTDMFLFPPGYLRAFTFNLALAAAPEFGKPVAPEVASMAAEALADVRALNVRREPLRCDAGMVGRGAGFDVLTGE